MISVGSRSFHRKDCRDSTRQQKVSISAPNLFKSAVKKIGYYIRPQVSRSFLVTILCIHLNHFGSPHRENNLAQVIHPEVRHWCYIWPKHGLALAHWLARNQPIYYFPDSPSPQVEVPVIPYQRGLATEDRSHTDLVRPRVLLRFCVTDNTTPLFLEYDWFRRSGLGFPLIPVGARSSAPFNIFLKWIPWPIDTCMDQTK